MFYRHFTDDSFFLQIVCRLLICILLSSLQQICKTQGLVQNLLPTEMPIPNRHLAIHKISAKHHLQKTCNPKLKNICKKLARPRKERPFRPKPKGLSLGFRISGSCQARVQGSGRQVPHNTQSRLQTRSPGSRSSLGTILKLRVFRNLREQLPAHFQADAAGNRSSTAVPLKPDLQQP